ncbi:MAG: methylmalonyl Co-A mutase-associated GTPase MeaB [Gammaproteobacteria bacterium]|jgi:LAO/AO transport system kinase|nr:methylmalonyl Co-A mutase-associated GTPase MeaB [Chromatiales bacterium]MCP4925095.1 methylmalonyl Co-A mutase-associated GTPase MeaB [Gammaproteobacteria bacterium]MDP7154355.1 methylmalonyl Co-A mutase-associated GTPase MeaB [Gammaproteobacteria bacterium]MDP7297239.1 methylmalonyl Co-A mutase-associated GTPase MeaB [Gammaproteobacteria bacterium]MDP7419797.1 methylmalonyl Co-A mutase-associated GTPase MeaB [Gammaproteobacteria bacterium]
MSPANPKQLARQVRDGDRRALARAITLVESTRVEDRKPANEILTILSPHAGNSIRIGISGPPGVGKSTFIESLGNHIIDQGHKVAVLAVDPSSAISGGSILGDKTRMETLSQRADAFIRPSPAGTMLGGVTRYTRETMRIVEAAGFDVIMIETVGVGQSETDVAKMTDFFLLMLLPGGGDELQGIKRGIVELADLIVVNKADGDLESVAARSAADYRAALGFLHPRRQGWIVPVVTCSALHNIGIVKIREVIDDFRNKMTDNGIINKSRGQQAKAWLWNEISSTLLESMRQNDGIRAKVAELEQQVTLGKISPWVAAQEIISTFQQQDNENS